MHLLEAPIDNPPEEKPKKMRHNAKTMTVGSLRPISRHRRDSSPSSDEVGGFWSISGPFRTVQSRCDGVDGAHATPHRDTFTQAMLRLFKGGEMHLGRAVRRQGRAEQWRSVYARPNSIRSP